MASGSIYLATSPDYPGLVKVGFTTQAARSRVKRLSGAGSLSRWNLVASRQVGHAREAEQLCHARLEQMQARLAPRREFFAVDEPTALKVLDEAAARFPFRMEDEAAPTSDACCSFPAEWDEFLSLQRRYGSQRVTFRELLSEHAVQRSRRAESRLRSLGVTCVNRHNAEVTYQIDENRAPDLLGELILSGQTKPAQFFRKHSLLTIRIL